MESQGRGRATAADAAVDLLLPILPPLPFFACPFLVATPVGWTWRLLRPAPTPAQRP